MFALGNECVNLARVFEALRLEALLVAGCGKSVFFDLKTKINLIIKLSNWLTFGNDLLVKGEQFCLRFEYFVVIL